MKLMYTWVEAHEQIAQKLLSYRDRQSELIDILKNAGVEALNDQPVQGTLEELKVMDPMTFFGYIYKHGPLRNKRVLRSVCASLEVDVDVKDICGVPSQNAQNVWYFPYGFERTNELDRLWDFFQKLMFGTVTQVEFIDILDIYSVGKSKLLNAMFRLRPRKYLCLNKVVNEYLRKKGIVPEYAGWGQLETLLEEIKTNVDADFPKLSYEAYLDVTYAGKQVNYFRIGTTAGESGASVLNEMITNQVASIGWGETGDLEEIEPLTKSNIAKKLVETHYPDGGGTPTRKAGEILNFLTAIQPGDVILAADGMAIKAIGKVISDGYVYDEELTFPHCRNVQWIKTGITDLHIDEGLRTSVWQFERPEVIDHIKAYMEVREYTATLAGKHSPNPPVSENTNPQPLNIILYGPPGTGKTYATIDKAIEIINGTKSNHDQNKIEFDKLIQVGQIAFVTFHQNYAYEQFVIGLHPDPGEKSLLFREKEGIFYTMADKARKEYDAAKSQKKEAKRFVLVIDEINRANISKVFGELITLLEEDKRLDGENELSMTLSNGKPFVVPPNLFLVGTMNTADKSISQVDIALRRRFTFIGKFPESSVLTENKFPDRAAFLDILNDNIYAKRKSSDYLIGHAYLLKDAKTEDAITGKILPLLMEFFNNRVEDVRVLFDRTGFDVTYDLKKHQWQVTSKPVVDGTKEDS
jgi:5-methylcytosine-specific restriction protein B